MKSHKSFAVSPLRLAAVVGASVLCACAPEIAEAAVAFGEIGRNVAENAKGIARGITMGGFAAGAGMGVWGCVDMYNASCNLFASSLVQAVA
jgi:hypothetical protein